MTRLPPWVSVLLLIVLPVVVLTGLYEVVTSLADEAAPASPTNPSDILTVHWVRVDDRTVPCVVYERSGGVSCDFNRAASTQ